MKSNFVVTYMAVRFSHSSLVAALLLLLRTTPTSFVQVEPRQTFNARVAEVTDGDTYDVRRSGGGQVTIRLHGVDALPESSQPYGRAATRAARRYVGGKNVRGVRRRDRPVWPRCGP